MLSISKWLRTSAVIRKAQSENACLMLRCPSNVRKHFEKQGLLGLPGADPENLHCTLLFLGPAEKVTPEIQENLIRDLEGALSRHTPQQLKFTGLGSFFPSDKGAPLVGLIDGLKLNALRDTATPICKKHLGTLPDTHGFLPHVTLAYLPMDEPHEIPSIGEIEPSEWTADAVTLMIKDKPVKDFPLRGETIDGDVSDGYSDPQGVQYLTKTKWRNTTQDSYPVVRGNSMSISKRLRAMRSAQNMTEYQKFFKQKLDKYNVKSPSELQGEEKKKFFDEVDKEWKGEKE